MPIIPPWSAFLFIKFKNELGSVRSNAPKNERANTKNIIKNTMFAVALVANAFKAEAPNNAANKTPRTIKIKMMDKP